MWSAALACLAAMALLAGSATAQETTGTITGVATDQTGAILPGVTVTVKHIQTGRTTEVVSNETGRYTARRIADTSSAGTSFMNCRSSGRRRAR